MKLRASDKDITTTRTVDGTLWLCTEAEGFWYTEDGAYRVCRSDQNVNLWMLVKSRGEKILGRDYQSMHDAMVSYSFLIA